LVQPREFLRVILHLVSPIKQSRSNPNCYGGDGVQRWRRR
jgi:hypothetical protein